MSAFLILDSKINDPEAYEEYKKQAKPIAEKYGSHRRGRLNVKLPFDGKAAL